MKNFVLALLLALGISNVSAATEATVNAPEVVSATELEAIIAQEDTETKAGLLNWVKANPIKVAAAVSAVAALTTYGYFAYKAYDKDAGYLAAAKAPGFNAYAACDEKARCVAGNIKEGFDKSVTYAQNNKPVVIGAAVAAAALVVVLIDLAQKDGYIRTACSKTADVATVVANDVATEVAVVANNVAEAVTNEVAS